VIRPYKFDFKMVPMRNDPFRLRGFPNRHQTLPLERQKTLPPFSEFPKPRERTTRFADTGLFLEMRFDKLTDRFLSLSKETKIPETIDLENDTTTQRFIDTTRIPETIDLVNDTNQPTDSSVISSEWM